MAREIAGKAAVIAWLQGMPQDDDDGSDTAQVIACDVLQRVRLFPADPNCVDFKGMTAGGDGGGTSQVVETSPANGANGGAASPFSVGD